MKFDTGVCQDAYIWCMYACRSCSIIKPKHVTFSHKLSSTTVHPMETNPFLHRSHVCQIPHSRVFQPFLSSVSHILYIACKKQITDNEYSHWYCLRRARRNIELKNIDVPFSLACPQLMVYEKGRIVLSISASQFFANGFSRFLSESSLQVSHKRVGKDCEDVGRSGKREHFIPNRIIAAVPLHCEPLFPSLSHPQQLGLLRNFYLLRNITREYLRNSCRQLTVCCQRRWNWMAREQS